jgi:RNA polymerase sigma-70 factor (ECF subfamily)
MVFNLHLMEGMNHKEIGEAMNISDGTSKSNLARARDILKQKVAQLYGSAETEKYNPS